MYCGVSSIIPFPVAWPSSPWSAYHPSPAADAATATATLVPRRLIRADEMACVGAVATTVATTSAAYLGENTIKINKSTNS